MSSTPDASKALKCTKCGKMLAWHFAPTSKTELVIRCNRCGHVLQWPPETPQ